MIRNSFQLFFYNIDDKRISTSPLFENAMYHDVHWIFAKEVGEFCTLFYHKELTLSNRNIKISKAPDIDERVFLKLLARIVLVVLLVFGMVFKAVFLLRNWEYIKKSNNFIIKKLEQQSKAEQPIVLFQNRNFIEKKKKNGQRNSFERIHEDVVYHAISPFFSINDLQSFAQVSRENY